MMDPTSSQGFYLHHLPYYHLLNQIFPGARFLQLGGGGYTAQYAAHLGAHVTCGLPTTQAIQQNKDLYPVPGLTWALASEDSLDFKDNAFDLVMIFDRISTVKDPLHLLKELRRILAPEGVALITLPNSDRDDLREIMGEGSSKGRPTAPGELYDPLSTHFQYVTLLTQTPFLGYLIAQYTEGKSSSNFDTLLGAQEPTLFHSFLVSDLEIVLEENRLIQVPFSHLMDRLQGGLRTFHRALEHKNNTLLELRGELEHLNQEQDQLIQRSRLAEAHLSQLKAAAEAALEQGGAPPTELLRTALLPPDLPDTIQEAPDEDAPSLSGVSEGEMRLLMEGLSGENIEEELEALPESQPPQEHQNTSEKSLLSDSDDSFLFQEDLVPFILPGPVPLASDLRREINTLRERLQTRTFSLTELEARRDTLEDLLGSIHRSVESHLGELRRWDPRDPMTQQWEEFRDLLNVIRSTATVDNHGRSDLRSEPASEDDEDKFESILRLRRELTLLRDGLEDASLRRSELQQNLREQATLQQVLEAELGERAESERNLRRETDRLNSRLQGASEEISTLEFSLQDGLAQAGSLELALQEETDKNKALAIQLSSKETAQQEHLAHLDLQNTELEQAQKAIIEQLQLEADTRQRKATEERASLEKSVATQNSRVDKAEKKLKATKEKRRLAEKNALLAEQRVEEAEENARLVEQRAEGAEESTRLATQRAESAETSALLATQRAEGAEKELAHIKARLAENNDTLKKAMRAKETAQLAADEALRQTLESAKMASEAALQSEENETHTRASTLALQAEIQALENTLEEKQSRLEDLQTENDTLQSNKSTVVAQNESELTRLKEENQASMDALKAEIKSLELKQEHTPVQHEQAASWQNPSMTDPSAQSRLLSALQDLHERLNTGLGESDWEEDDDFGPEATQRLPKFMDMAPEANADEKSALALDIQRKVEHLFALVDLRSRSLVETRALLREQDSTSENLKQALSETEPELTALRAQVGELLNNNLASEESISKTEGVEKTLRADLSQLNTQLADSEEERRILQDDLARALADGEGAQALAESIQRVSELETTLDGLAGEQEDTETRHLHLLQLEDTLQEMGAEKREMSLQLHRRNEELSELQAELQRAWSQTLGGHQSVTLAQPGEGLSTAEDIESLQEDPLQMLEERILNLEQSLRKKEGQVERLLQELDIKASHNKTLKTLVGRHQHDLRHLRKRVKDALKQWEGVDEGQQKLRGLSLENLRQRLDELPE